MRQGPDGGKFVALGTFSFVFESEMCGCQPRNAVNGMGCTGVRATVQRRGERPPKGSGTNRFRALTSRFVATPPC